MIYKTLEIDDFIDDKDENVQFIDILEKENAQLKIVSLKKHQEIEPHCSETNACIYMTEGEIEIIFDGKECHCTTCSCQLAQTDDDKEYKYKIKKGQLFIFEKDVSHSVKALKDSSFLLVKI